MGNVCEGPSTEETFFKQRERTWERQEATENLAAPNILDICLDIGVHACICACIRLSVCLSVSLCVGRNKVKKPGGKRRGHKQWYLAIQPASPWSEEREKPEGKDRKNTKKAASGQSHVW